MKNLQADVKYLTTQKTESARTRDCSSGKLSFPQHYRNMNNFGIRMTGKERNKCALNCKT